MGNAKKTAGNEAWDADKFNNDPIKEPVSQDDFRNDAPLHPQYAQSDKLKSSGVEVGSVNQEVKSINPISLEQAEGNINNKDKYKIIDKANRFVGIERTGFKDAKYPFADLKLGQGIFIPVQPNSTTDSLMDDVHEQIEIFRRQAADIEKDEKGDDISESIIVHTRKRTPEGHIQLDDLGKPITGANQTIRPKYIYTANFVARAVIKGNELVENGQKADNDGVLLVRVL